MNDNFYVEVFELLSKVVLTDEQKATILGVVRGITATAQPVQPKPTVVEEPKVEVVEEPKDVTPPVEEDKPLWKIEIDKAIKDGKEYLVKSKIGRGMSVYPICQNPLCKEQYKQKTIHHSQFVLRKKNCLDGKFYCSTACKHAVGLKAKYRESEKDIVVEQKIEEMIQNDVEVKTCLDFFYKADSVRNYLIKYYKSGQQWMTVNQIMEKFEDINLQTATQINWFLHMSGFIDCKPACKHPEVLTNDPDAVYYQPIIYGENMVYKKYNDLMVSIIRRVDGWDGEELLNINSYISVFNGSKSLYSAVLLEIGYIDFEDDKFVASKKYLSKKVEHKCERSGCSGTIRLTKKEYDDMIKKYGHILCSDLCKLVLKHSNK